MGIFLCLASLLGVLVILAEVMVVVQGERSKHPEVFPFFLAFGIVATLVFLVPGLYLTTRSIRARLTESEVICESGWCLRRRVFRRPLSKYIGLLRDSKTVGTMDAASAAQTIVGLAATAAFGVGMIASKQIPVHMLLLKAAEDKADDVLLMCSPNAQAVHDLMDQLAKMFSLNVLDPTLEGYDIRRPADLDTPITARISATGSSVKSSCSLPHKANASSWPEPSRSSAPWSDLPPAPPGLQCTQQTGALTVLVPPEKTGVIAGLAVGIPFLGLGVLSLIFVDSPSGSARAGMLLATLMGLFMIGCAIIFSKCRWTLRISSAGVSIAGWGVSKHPRLFMWNTIKAVTAARMKQARKPALLISTSSGDQWLLAGAKKEWLVWIRDAILCQAARKRDSGDNEGDPTDIATMG